MSTATKIRTLSTRTLSTLLGAAALSLLMTAGPLQAQSRWSLEVRGNAAVPTNELAGEDLGTGVGFEGNVGYHLYEHMSVYAGWDWTHFNADQSFAGPDMDFEETGYVFGLRWEHPFRGEVGNGLAGWIRAGASVKHIEVEDDEGEIVADSGHGLGWEVGAGLSLPLGGSWRLTPGLRYRALSRELEAETATVDWDIQDVTFELGARWHF